MTIGAAEGICAVGVEMVGECPGHEFDGWQSKRPRDVLGVPAGVKCDVAHRKARRKGAGIFIHHGFEAEVPAYFRCVPDHVVSRFVGRLLNVS